MVMLRIFETARLDQCLVLSKNFMTAIKLAFKTLQALLDVLKFELFYQNFFENPDVPKISITFGFLKSNSKSSSPQNLRSITDLTRPRTDSEEPDFDHKRKSEQKITSQFVC
jgi:hypothetical protein